MVLCSSEMQTERELKICSQFYQLYTVIRVESVSTYIFLFKIFLTNINDLQKFDSLNRRLYDLMFIVMFARSYQLLFLSINHCEADISSEF